MRNLKFYREPDGRWYVDLPEWEGEKEELEMVQGADVLLDIIDQNGDANGVVNALVVIDPNQAKAGVTYQLRNTGEVLDSGANYEVWGPFGIRPFKIWLCDVTKFVFDGEFPGLINLEV